MLFVGSYHVEDGRQNRVLISYTVLYSSRPVSSLLMYGRPSRGTAPPLGWPTAQTCTLVER